MWTRAIIPINLFKDEDQIYKFLDDFIRFCDKHRYVTFHFFIENCTGIDDCLELRAEHDIVSHAYETELKELVEKQFEPLFFAEDGTKREIIPYIEYDTSYCGETYNFGEEGWQIAKKIFEYTCRAAVHIKIGRATKLFRETKFIHCFLNQCRYDSLKESAFHSNAAWQMMVKHIREQNRGKKCE